MPDENDWGSFDLHEPRQRIEDEQDRRAAQALDDTFGAGYWESTRADRERQREMRELERQRVIEFVSSTLRQRINGIIGSPMNPQTMQIIQNEVGSALDHLGSVGINRDDLQITVDRNPSDPNGIILTVDQRQMGGPVLRRVDHINNSFGESPVGSVLNAVAGQMVAVEEANRRIFSEQSLLPERFEVPTAAVPVGTTLAQAEELGRTMAEAYARRIQELGLGNAPSELAPRPPPDERDTTDNFTPRRKLEID